MHGGEGQFKIHSNIDLKHNSDGSGLQLRVGGGVNQLQCQY